MALTNLAGFGLVVLGLAFIAFGLWTAFEARKKAIEVDKLTDDVGNFDLVKLAEALVKLIEAINKLQLWLGTTVVGALLILGGVWIASDPFN